MPKVTYVGLSDLVGLTMNSVDPAMAPVLREKVNSVLARCRSKLSESEVSELLGELGKFKCLENVVNSTKHLVRDEQSLATICTSVNRVMDETTTTTIRSTPLQPRTVSTNPSDVTLNHRRPASEDEQLAWDIIRSNT